MGEIEELKGDRRTYIPPDHPTAPLKGGWLVRQATINPPLEGEALDERAVSSSRLVDDLSGIPAAIRSAARTEDEAAPTGGMPADPVASAARSSRKIASGPIPKSPISRRFLHFRCVSIPAILRIHDLFDRKIELSRGNYFLKSSLTFQAMTRKPDWYKFATTRDLIEGLSDPSTEGTERIEVATFVHGRILRPFLGLNLLFMSLPLVLGGYGRNAFINLGFALGNSALFYGAILFCSLSRQFRRPVAADVRLGALARVWNDRHRAVGTDPDMKADR